MSRPENTEQQAEVLALLRERGDRGILSTESVDLGIPGLQQRVGELRAQGWPVRSEHVPGTRLVRYVLPVGSVQGAPPPLEAGCRIVVRGGHLAVRPRRSPELSRVCSPRLSHSASAVRPLLKPWVE